MQKLDLRNNLFEIVKELKSQELTELLDKAKIPNNELLKLVIDSKGAYDKATVDKDKMAVLTQLQIPEIYSTGIFSNMVSTISNLASERNRPEFIQHKSISTFYSHHKTLIITFNLIDKLLIGDQDYINEDRSFNLKEALENGNLFLQIVEEKNISLDRLILIIKNLKKLIESIYLLFDKVEKEIFDEKPSIILIDSGSDINFNIHLPKKAANLIAQIIKELWDISVNNKVFRHKQKLSVVESSLTIMQKINEAKKKEIIEPEMAEILKKDIYESTLEIISNNTVTKEILIENKELSNRQLLLERTQTKQLEEGTSIDNKSENGNNDIS